MVEEEWDLEVAPGGVRPVNCTSRKRPESRLLT